MRQTKHQSSLLVTFEGIDGCGKSTQLAKAFKYLTERGHDVVKLREPGSTAVAERIRRLLLDRRVDMSDVTELLLYEAARSDLVTSTIAPLLQRGKVVLCDRYYDSTTAYQGYGRKLNVAMVKRLHRVAVGFCKPDLTLVYDVDLKTSYLRRGKQADRLEAQSREFFKRVRRGFLEIARQEPRRVKVIDGTSGVSEVFEQTRKLIEGKLSRR